MDSALRWGERLASPYMTMATSYAINYIASNVIYRYQTYLSRDQWVIAAVVWAVFILSRIFLFFSTLPIRSVCVFADYVVLSMIYTMVMLVICYAIMSHPDNIL